MDVPGFLARQFLVSGSLRNTDGGWSIDVQNPLGDGSLVGVGQMNVDGRPISMAAVTCVRASDGFTVRAFEIGPARPVAVRRGDRVTIHVAGEPLSPGNHELRVELTEANVGALRFKLTERLARQ